MLRSTGAHPTAGWVYDRLKRESPNLSMGTVYRNLNILLEQGLIRKIDFGSTFDRFDANISSHYHFICDRCRAIVDLQIPIAEELNQRVTEKTHYRVHRHRIEFYGVCEQCAGKAEDAS